MTAWRPVVCLRITWLRQLAAPGLCVCAACRQGAPGKLHLCVCGTQPKRAHAAQVLRDPKQKRFFKSRDIHDLFTLGDQYAAGGSETAAIFSSLHGGLEVPLDPDALAVPAEDAAPPPDVPGLALRYC